MAAQHKRPGRTARLERIRRARERELVRWIREQTVVQFPCKRKQRDGFPGRVVAVGIPPDMEGIVRKQTCTCGAIKGKKTILNSHAIVGVTTEFQDNEVFKNNKGVYLENNYCPQCGTPYEIIGAEVSLAEEGRTGEREKGVFGTNGT